MPTVVRDLMSAPVVTCEAGTSLAGAARTMRDAGIGSVIVTERGKVAGILTERDLLRAAAAATAASAETVEMWMTANPDVLGPEEEVDAAWTSLAHHQYRHLPVVDGDRLVGVVSLRDLMGVARLRPVEEHGTEVPAGLEGVVAAETALGDVRGEEGFFHYRQHSAVDLAARRSLEDVWYLLLEGELPDRAQARRFAAEVAALRTLAPGLAAMMPEVAAPGHTLRGPAHGGVPPRRRVGLAPDARHRQHRVAGPGAGTVRGGRPPSWPPPTTWVPDAPSWSPGPTSPARPTTCGW